MPSENAIDEQILRLADTCSPEEISLIIGGILSPARVAARTADLLKAQDWLTERQQEQLVLRNMRVILRRLSGPHMDLDTAKVSLQYLKAIGDRLDKRAAANEQDLQTYNDNVGRQLGHVVDMALSYMKGALREEVDPDRWDELVLEALDLAQAEILSKQVESP